jgi:hypothetical protein
MIDKSEIIEQTNLAFDVIGKPSGYGISNRSSTGLESTNVSFWVVRKFAVCFIPESDTTTQRGQTVTELHENLKILYLRFVLNGKDITEPAVYSGVLRDIERGPRGTAITKFENLMGFFEYANDKLFGNPGTIRYEDGTMSIKGELHKVNLYDVNDSDAIRTQIVEPSLLLFRENWND